MTKKELVGGIMASLLIMSMLTAYASAAPTEQVYAKSNAPIATEAIYKPVVLEASKKPKQCKNWLVKVLRESGFRGKGLRISWAIVMRESGGKADSISSTHDYGMFQFNYAAWHKQAWWNSKKLLTRSYNASVAYKISQGGKTFYPWDIDGAGRFKARYTSKATYKKFKEWYDLYPCK